MVPTAMVVGHRYQIIHIIPGVQKRPRRSVLSYLGKTYDGKYQFNARPVAGTTSLTTDMILAIEEVQTSTPIEINKLV